MMDPHANLDEEQLCDSLIIWVQTFHIAAPCKTAGDLSDGAAMAQVLHQIAPAFFNDAWMSRIKAEDAVNWRVKANNLKKVLNHIRQYNSEVLGVHLQDFRMPDVNAIAEFSSPSDLGRLLQLILGCAVNCEDKQEYIRRIMGMEESHQLMVMKAIKELMTKEGSSSNEGESSRMTEQLRKTTDELQVAIGEKEELAQRCHELDMQIAQSQDEMSNLMAENERLSDQVNQAESLDDPSTAAGRRFQQLQNQIDQLHEDVFRLETSKEDFRIKNDMFASENVDLQQKVTDLSAVVSSTQPLRDEVDVLRNSVEQVAKQEKTIEIYKKKLEDMGDLKGQLKIMEEKHGKVVQETIDLNEEVKRMTTLKQSLEMYKRQVFDLQNSMAEETKRADKAEFESRRASEKMITLQKEKERLANERDSLRELNDELKCSQYSQMGSSLSAEMGDSLEGSHDELSSSSQNLDLINAPPLIKERLLQLEHENKMLKLNKSEIDEEQSRLLQTMLDDTKARNNELETEIRIANQRLLELQAQIDDIQESNQMAAATATSDSFELRQKLTDQVHSITSLRSDVQSKLVRIEELEIQAQISSETMTVLQEKVASKDEQLIAMEAKYKKYLDKARAVIHSLDPKLRGGGSASPEISALKNQMAEKDRQLQHVQKEQDKIKSSREFEERLMVTAWYNMGMQLHRKAVEERLVNSGAGQSFLSRQRQAPLRRTQTISGGASNSIR